VFFFLNNQWLVPSYLSPLCSGHGSFSSTNKNSDRGWGFSSVVEHLPSKRKVLGSVPSFEKKKRKKKKKKNSDFGCNLAPFREVKASLAINAIAYEPLAHDTSTSQKKN